MKTADPCSGAGEAAPTPPVHAALPSIADADPGGTTVYRSFLTSQVPGCIACPGGCCYPSCSCNVPLPREVSPHDAAAFVAGRRSGPWLGPVDLVVWPSWNTAEDLNRDTP